MLDREKAIDILEENDNTWDYEDMEDDELIKRLVSDIGCVKVRDLDLKKCEDTTCTVCWRITLSK